MKTFLKRWQSGQGMTEYIIIISMVAVAAIVGYQMFGSSVRDGAASNATGMTTSHFGGGGMVNGQYMSAQEAAQSVAGSGAVDMATARANGMTGSGAVAAVAATGGQGATDQDSEKAENGGAGGGGGSVMKDDSVWDNSASVEVRQAPRSGGAAPEESSNLLLIIGIIIGVMVAIYMFMGDSGSGSSGGGASFGQFDGSIENSSGQGGGGGAFMPSFSGGGSGGGGTVVDNSRDVGAGRFQPPVDQPVAEGGSKYGKQGVTPPPAAGAQLAGSQFPNVGPKTGLKRAGGIDS